MPVGLFGDGVTSNVSYGGYSVLSQLRSQRRIVDDPIVLALGPCDKAVEAHRDAVAQGAHA